MKLLKYTAAAALGAAAAALYIYLALSSLFTEAILHIGSGAAAAPALADGSGRRYITADDGAVLTALCLPQPKDSGKWALLLHGYTSGKEDMLSYAQRYISEGYSVVIPDQRAHGESGGEYCGLGWLERRDVIRWVESITDSSPEARIVLHGVSMGAAAALMAAGEGLPENVGAIISDCSFTSAADIISFQLEQRLGSSAALIAPGGSLMTRLRLGCSWDDASALEAVALSSTPTLFIHGSTDEFAPVRMSSRLYAAAASPKELCIIPGAAHASSAYKDAEKYWTAVFRFISKYSSMHKSG